MDEFKSQINNWVQIANGLVDYDKVIEEFLNDVEHRSVPEVIVDKTPKQPKKKRNVLSTINASVNGENDESTGKKSLTKKTLDPMLQEAENDVSQQKINERPSRAAKGKAIGNLKEPALWTKMRNDVKKERISNLSNSVNQTGTSINLTEHSDDSSYKSGAKMEVGIPQQSKPEGTEIRHSNNKKVKLSSQVNTSIEIMPMPEIKIELVSDEEKEKMPPPSQPPPKTKKKNKAGSKSSNSSNIGEIIPASDIKQEPSESVSIISAPSNNNTRLKRTKGKKKRNISESETSNSQVVNSADDEVDGDRNPLKKTDVEKSDEATKEAVPIPTLNGTFESVYEDAISDNAKKADTSATNVQEVKNVSVVLTKMSTLDLNSIKSSGIEILINDNFNNATFNMNVTRTVDPGETFTAEKDQANSTFVVPLSQINGTIIIDKKEKENGLQSSLITDDESETDESNKRKYESNKQKSKNMAKNEIFNPLIQSPVRKKVQAFEQHAAMNLNGFGSPSGTRVARIKSRVQDLKENRDTNTPVSRIPKPETPGAADSRTHRYLTPKEMTSTSMVNHNLKKKFNSTSKLQGLGSNGGSKSSTSRENSVEDLKRGASLLQLAAEEKKRKREEKQKHAQQIREAKDREKREAAERVAREKQEKSKKLLQEREEKAREEFEKKKIIREHKFQKIDRQRNLEEIKKNLQIPQEMEQKRDGQLVYELQKKKLAETKERDLLDVARMNAMRDEINRDLSYHIQETSTASKQAPKKKQYDFDLLLSGDSTDEEDKQTTKKPPPPTWSISKVRQPVIREQNYIQWKIVDTLFSVQPMTIDLQEIFPTIDSRYLKRNSSVIWSTPPRYSELPKY